MLSDLLFGTLNTSPFSFTRGSFVNTHSELNISILEYFFMCMCLCSVGVSFGVSCISAANISAVQPGLSGL
jgi:hypothetical protein